jgi:hypothetical protein
VILTGRCWPGNRNDVTVARHTVVELLDGHIVLGDSGYRAITSITTPRRDHTGRIIRDDHYRVHRRIRARVEHVIARLTDWKYCDNAAAAARPSTTASKQSPDSGKTDNQLRVNS